MVTIVVETTNGVSTIITETNINFSTQRIIAQDMGYNIIDFVVDYLDIDSNNIISLQKAL